MMNEETQVCRNVTAGLSEDLAEITLLAQSSGALTSGADKADTKMETQDEDETLADDEMSQAIAAIAKNKEAMVKSSAAALTKHLQNLKKKPTETRYRKMRTDNIIVKKFITDVPGALDFMKAVGFTEAEEGAKKYLQIDPETVDPEKIDRAVCLLAKALEAIEAKKQAPQEEKKRVKCSGCKVFWGNAETEDLCSVCHKKKYNLGGGGASMVDDNTPVRCTGKDCQFFGAKKFGGLCSVCWGKEQKKHKADSWRPKFKRAKLCIRAVNAFKAAPRLKQTNKKRCWTCKRKIGITGIECRCGYLFCGKHRYPDEHNCEFDHRQRHQRKLRLENKQILNKKLDRVDDE